MALLAFFGSGCPLALFVSRQTKSSIFSSPVGIPSGHLRVLFMGLFRFPPAVALGNAACWAEAGNTHGRGGVGGGPSDPRLIDAC